LPARTHQELRWREPFEPSANEVKALRITYDPCFLITEAKPPCREEFSQLGEDDRFELPSRTGQHHEVIGVANQPQVPEFRIFSVRPVKAVLDARAA
jgi:hypothetical protein